MDFDVIILYLSAMWDENSIYVKIKTSYAFTPHMNDEIVEKFNSETFTQGGANLKIMFSNPPDLLFQPLTVREKVTNIDINRMRNGYTIDASTSVDFQETTKSRTRGHSYKNI